jgi:hypothetical protein
MDEAERAELIAAIVTLTTAVEEILALTERLLGAHEATITPSTSELADARDQVGLSWCVCVCYLADTPQ